MSDVAAKSVAQNTREWAQFVIVAFVAAFGVYQFYIKEILLPSRRPADLAITAELVEIGRKGNMILLRARIHAVNRSTNRVYLGGMWYTVTGVRFEVRDKPEHTTWLELHRSARDQAVAARCRVSDLEDAWFNLFAKLASCQVVATWRHPVSFTWYDPAKEATYEQVFYVPASAYDAVRLKAHVNMMRNRDDLADETWNVDSDGSLYPTMRLKVPGWENDPSQVEDFDPSIPRHKKWEEDNGVAQSVAYSIVSLSNSAPASTTLSDSVTNFGVFSRGRRNDLY